ncbi:lipoxygenase homology domain-containing protein 1-like [Physella acuta]|uniref:lipoxygenase homology domain-containing protein 1-like n=1 Tax=Physella acuta TaxID=109671 RepID=UPI0027DAD00A|nr:lipoxygenase homology domain-containing protein 1-like [Physella acuta]
MDIDISNYFLQNTPFHSTLPSFHNLEDHHDHTITRSRSSTGSSRVKYTWAGPINTQLYSDSLNELCQVTKENLEWLERVKSAPTSYHSSREESNMSPSDSRQDLSVMFAPRETLSTPSRSTFDDDVSSTQSGPVNFCYLCHTLEEHQKHLKLTFNPKEKKARKIPYMAPAPRVRTPVEPEPQPIFHRTYRVVVWTGDVAGATTDANIFVTIKGAKNILHKTRLFRGSSKRKFPFVQGSCESFFIKGPNLGNLEILTIENDGVQKDQSWFCEKVEVTCMKTLKKWLFTCHNWLSLFIGDYLTKRDLMASYIERKPKDYKLTIKTGSKHFSGTDSNVFVTLYGTDQVSPKLQLLNPKKKYFQRKSVDEFPVHFPSIGEIKALRIEHDGKGLAPGWFLKKVTLVDIEQPDCVYEFLCNDWLSKDEGNGLLWRKIFAHKKPLVKVSTEKPIRYEVTVKTGDVKYAGTDANVYIKIQGQKGKTKKLFMDDARNNFERGTTETFQLTAPNTGPIKSICIGHDNSGPGAGWFCEDVTVRKYLTKGEITTFLKNLKKSHNPKHLHKKRLSEKIKEGSLDADDDEEESDEDDEDTDGVVYKDVFDVDGKVVKLPVYEEYYFVCKKWLAKDEKDGQLERRLTLSRKNIFLKDKKDKRSQ